MRTFILRLRPGTDLMEGIRVFCEERGIRSGAITTLLGSLRQVRYVYPVVAPGTKAGLKYCDPIAVNGPIEVLCGAGTIGVMKSDGTTVVHLHAAFTDPEGRAYPGGRRGRCRDGRGRDRRPGRCVPDACRGRGDGYAPLFVGRLDSGVLGDGRLRERTLREVVQEWMHRISPKCLHRCP